VEDWEKEKTVEDMERYEWDVMPSKRNIVHTLKAIKETKVRRQYFSPTKYHDVEIPSYMYQLYTLVFWATKFSYWVV
jgi:hypothetical protein